jgi:hypothetical protein
MTIEKERPNMIRHTSVLFGALLVLMAAVPPQAQTKVDVTGTWVFDVKTDAGPGTPTLTLKQDGETLSGHYSSATLGEAELKGTVKGEKINFGFTATVQGTAIEVTYSGTIEGNSAMTGTINLGGVGGGTFTGKRK